MYKSKKFENRNVMTSSKITKTKLKKKIAQLLAKHTLLKHKLKLPKYGVSQFCLQPQIILNFSCHINHALFFCSS